MKSETAVSIFEDYNCCQSVLTAYGPEAGLCESRCLALGSGLGTGMNAGETCGAVVGAYLVLGLKYGTSNPLSRARVKDLCLQFDQRFKAERGSLRCKELLGVDVSNDDGRQAALDQDLFNRQCPHFISSACEILDQLIGEKEQNG